MASLKLMPNYTYPSQRI